MFDVRFVTQVEAQREVANSGMKAKVRELEAKLQAAHRTMAETEHDLSWASDEVRMHGLIGTVCSHVRVVHVHVCVCVCVFGLVVFLNSGSLAHQQFCCCELIDFTQH